MARAVERFTDLKVRKLATQGRHHDGAGLYVQISKTGAKSWLFQFMLNGRQRWMGLGSFPDTSLKEAREAAQTARKQAKGGVDPIEARKAAQEAQQTAQRRAEAAAVSFRQAAEDYIAAHRAGWRNAKHAAQWTSTLTTYVYPHFGDLPVADINVERILRALRPIWTEKPETATRVRQRIESVLDAATAQGLRQGENPARWKGHLDKLLPRRAKVAAVRHHSAMAYSALPDFWVDLSARTAMSARAMAFLILTAARSGEVRGAAWREIDLDAQTWTIPAERMKSRRAHRVPLTDAALDILKAVRPKDAAPDAVVFPGLRGRSMSDATMRKLLQEDMDLPGVTVHGFRSSFRDWVAEQTGFPRELAEAALAHVLRDQTEAAYQRGDMFDRRRELMNAWSAYCLSGHGLGNVVRLERN